MNDPSLSYATPDLGSRVKRDQSGEVSEVSETPKLRNEAEELKID